VEWWFAQNMLMFVREDYLESHPLLKRERANTFPSQLSLVHPKKYLETAEWIQRINLTADDLTGLIPAAGTFILIDEGQLGNVLGIGRHALPFLRRDGQYWGAPPDDATAVRELERLRRSGASFLVVAWPAFWWLDYFGGWHRYLRSRFRCALENDRLIAFDLRPSAKQPLRGGMAE
jgi:hypothetical protein